jgi:hypothetical protein
MMSKGIGIVQRFILDQMEDDRAFACSTLARIYAKETGVEMTSTLRYSMRRGARRLMDQGLVDGAYVPLPTDGADRWHLIVYPLGTRWAGRVDEAHLNLLLHP